MKKSGIKLKGTGIKPVIEYIYKTHGKEGWDKVLANLPADVRTVISGTILATSWYDIEDFATFLETSDKVFSNGNGYFVEKSGKYSADYAMNAIYRVFFKIGSPGYIIEKSSSLWEKYYTHGKMVVLERTANTVLLELQDFPFANWAWCGGITAYMERILELTGAKNPSLKQIECNSRGHPCCKWKGKWD
ncbi:MAG: hypothetical protein QW728_02980 [Thermoplasmata archaeon]